jgi:hypothetical protein
VAGIAIFTAGGIASLGERQMPLVGNALEHVGLGWEEPWLAAGYHAGLGSSGNGAAHDLWLAMTIAGLAGAGMLAGAMVRTLRRAARDYRETPRRSAPVALAGVAFLLLVLVFGGMPAEGWYDRYLLAFIPVCAALSVRPALRTAPIGTGSLIIAMAALILFGVFGVVSTHDALASRRARWEAYGELLQTRTVGPSDVAEWDFNGWNYGQHLEQCNPEFHRTADRRATWDDFTCLRDYTRHRYFAAYEPGSDSVVTRASFPRWLPPRQQSVYIVERSVHPDDAP